MALDEREIDLISAEVAERVEKRLIERGDERYVMAQDCNERQEKVNKRFANDDKRIEIISHDFAVIKKLMWAVATATIGTLVVAFFELILR
jgi:hypothetical protein